MTHMTVKLFAKKSVFFFFYFFFKKRWLNKTLILKAHWAALAAPAAAERTHQDVLELDVSVQEALAVQEADPLHHVQSDLQPLPERQAGLWRAESSQLSGGDWHCTIITGITGTALEQIIIWLCRPISS